MTDGQVPRKRKQETVLVVESLDRYSDLVEEGKRAAKQESESTWELGDLAARVEKCQGRPGGGLKQYAKDIGADHGTLKIYRTIALAFPKVNRLAKLPYSHYQTAYYHCNKGRDGEPDIGAALGWLKRADDEGLSKRQLAAAIDDARNDAILKSVDKLPDGKYRCIVVDPPWPYKAGLRLDDRPDLEGFDYPQMTLEEIMSLDVGRIAHDDCHLFLWATQRALRDAFEVLDAWGFNHRCTLVWHKNGGHTPIEVGFMYNAEFVLYATKGDLPLQKIGEKVVFEGKRRKHSQKPDEFYDLVKRVSLEPRIDVFAREPHDGFAGWGAEFVANNDSGRSEVSNGAGQISGGIIPSENHHIPISRVDRERIREEENNVPRVPALGAGSNPLGDGARRVKPAADPSVRGWLDESNGSSRGAGGIG